MKERLDIIISGVGGQGTILASRVLAQAALDAGLTAGTAETIGMAQREGSVQSHVRIGSPGFGPLIGKHGADVLLGFEPAEAQRACPLMKPDGIGLVNLHPVHPATVALGATAYPLGEIKSYLCALPGRMRFINAFQLANVAGNFRTVNAVMLGALAGTGILPVAAQELLKVLVAMVPERVRAVNERAFELGFEACKACL